VGDRGLSLEAQENKNQDKSRVRTNHELNGYILLAMYLNSTGKTGFKIS